MCGIVGYIGNKNAYQILVQGLKLLEYRGYDSAGLAIYNESLNVYKCKGRVLDLELYVSDKNVSGNIGIGHTRWATHGEPNDINAHPHVSMNGDFVLVHNGIIENYSELREYLKKKGYSFSSDTDSEVLVNLIEYFYRNISDANAEMATRLALSKVIGAYGVVLMSENEVGQLIVARKGSPLVIGVGSGEYYIASDAGPLVNYTRNVIYMNDHEMAVLKKDSLSLKTLDNIPVSALITKIEQDVGDVEKGDFEYFMLKEIFEQPKTIFETVRGRITPDKNDIILGGLLDVFPKLINARRIILIGCGTSWHAALVGEYLIEEYARTSVEVEYASEFRYRNPVLDQDDVVIAISQSGETADTLAAIRMAKERGATVLGICNVVGSSIARETDGGVYTHAGVEIGVASTKAFTAQTTVLTLLAFKLAKEKNKVSSELYKDLIQEILTIPQKIEEVLNNHIQIKEVASKYKDSVNAMYLGRGYLYPVAMEGSLKLKEISYIHAEGFAAGEMKHGAIALVDDNIPVVVVAPRDKYYEKIVSNIQEVKARKGNVIAVITEGDMTLKDMVNDQFQIPSTHPSLMPLLSVVPLQLFAYHIAVMRGCNVDQPRNLAKSVTVE